jgi:hypothetical protein
MGHAVIPIKKNTTPRDSTKYFQSQIRKVVNDSTTRIPHETKWRHTNINPSAPSIKRSIKLHKPEQPI